MVIGMEQAVEVLRSGGPLIFPTDTVWGIGVAVEHCAGTAALAQAKGRDAGKPIAWLVADASALDAYGCEVPAYARRLADAFWPGALTLVVKASPAVPWGYASADGTIGLRMPDSACALALAQAAESPLAATSANLAGYPARSVQDAPDEEFAASCGVPVLDVRGPGDAVAASGRPHAAAAVASAVVDCVGAVPRLLRAGTITASEMQGACGASFGDAPRL